MMKHNDHENKLLLEALYFDISMYYIYEYKEPIVSFRIKTVKQIEYLFIQVFIKQISLLVQKWKT